MHSRIYLIGFMGSGKTTYGKRIARMMDYEFLDLDHWIEEKEKLSVSEIFSRHGENYFRKCETEAIIRTKELEKYVISTGGGAPCYNKNMDLLKKLGLTVYLKLSPKALMSRLIVSHRERPLMAGKSEEEMLHTIESMLEDREPIYNQAEMIIDGLENVDERIVNAIQRK